MIVFLVYNRLILIMRNGATLGLQFDKQLRNFGIIQNLRVFVMGWNIMN